MNDDDTLQTIGDLSRRTGLPVKTIRYYSDLGIVPPTDRTPAGYRLYDADASARLDLVRTLRELGVDLATVQRLLDREISMPELAATHADALDVQIRTLRLRRAVLLSVARRGSSTEELELMNQLAKLSNAERRHIVHTFIDEVFAGLEANDEFVEMLRMMVPEMPDEPSTEQVEAWIELAELIADPAFIASFRRAAEHQAAERAEGDPGGLHGELVGYVREKIGAALDAGVDPVSDAARPILDDVIARYCETFRTTDSRDYRAKLLTRLRVADDPDAERYSNLIATINGWEPMPTLVPVFAWFIAALERNPDPS